MSRAFAPAEQGEPENKTEREDFKSLLRSLHTLRHASLDQPVWDRSIPPSTTHP